MEERESIALNVQFPAGALEGLTRLVQQLRCLAAEVGAAAPAVSAAPAAPVESGENPAFDSQRFQGLAPETTTRFQAPPAGGDAEAGAPGTERAFPAEDGASPLCEPRQSARPEDKDSALTPPAEMDPLSTLDTPPSAGFALSAIADRSGARRTAAQAAPADTGSAGLTARAVSQAFRRDGRRYDNAFPLY